jgi:N utilization substance protein A
MAKKKPQTGSRSKSKKHQDAEPAPFSTPIPAPDPALGAPQLGTALDLEEVQIRGPQAAEEKAELQPETEQGLSAGQAGSLQGLSDVAEAAPESVDELLEEGNAFEAEVVAGVEEAPNADQGEVRTHETPEDDVPGESLDPEP